MVWRGMGRLTALVVFGFASAPASAEPLIQIAQAEQSEGGAPAENADPAIEPEVPPASTAEPARETGADSQAETPAPAASPPPKQSDAELETITVKPSHKTPRTTTVARKPAPGASAGEPGGAQAASAATTAPPLSLLDDLHRSCPLPALRMALASSTMLRIRSSALTMLCSRSTPSPA